MNLPKDVPPIKLNPFVFPTETDGRFLLLVMVVVGVSWQLGEWIFMSVFELSEGLSALLAFVPTILILGLAWIRARRDGKNEICVNGWRHFSAVDENEKNSPLLNTIHQSSKIIGTALPEINQVPAFVLDEQSIAVTGRAFGYGTSQFVVLRKGLVHAFVAARDKFYAVLLHELGHVANQDVTKTTFSIQLGRCFSVYALIFFVIQNGNAFRRWVMGQDGQLFTANVDFWPTIVDINVSFVLCVIWIWIIRSSVLRIREYYADVRAAYWYGRKRPLLQHFCESLRAQQSRKQQKSIFQHLRHVVAPLHPTFRQRMQVVKNPNLLFAPQWKTAVFAGMLCGLILNSLSILVANLLHGLSKTMDMPIVSLIIIQVIGFVLAFILPSILFGAYPIAKTVGIAVQKAAFADQILPDTGMRKLTLLQVLKLAFCLGIGIQIGILISPLAGAYSLSSGGFGLTALPGLLIVFTFCWGGVFLTWILPLRALAGKLYCCHLGQTLPHRKQRWLLIVSSLALLPPVLAMGLVQIFGRSLVLNSEEASWGYFVGGIVIACLVGLAGYLFFWIGGWLLFVFRGWLKKPTDHNDSITWAEAPNPISFPNLPAIQTSVAETPPPL